MWSAVNKKWLIAAVGAGAIAAWFYLHNSQEKVELTEDGFLTINSVVRIFDKIRAESSKDFTQLMYETRKKRRAAQNYEQYINAQREFEEEYENLLSYKQGQVLIKLKLDQDRFESSIEHYVNGNNQDIRALISRTFQYLQDNIPASKKLTREEFIGIMNERISYLKDNTKTLLQELEDALRQKGEPVSMDFLVPLVQNKVGDHLFNKFGVEREDLQYFQKKCDLTKDVDVKAVLDEAVATTTRLFSF